MISTRTRRNSIMLPLPFMIMTNADVLITAMATWASCLACYMRRCTCGYGAGTAGMAVAAAGAGC